MRAAAIIDIADLVIDEDETLGGCEGCNIPGMSGKAKIVPPMTLLKNVTVVLLLKESLH